MSVFLPNSMDKFLCMEGHIFYFLYTFYRHPPRPRAVSTTLTSHPRVISWGGQASIQSPSHSSMLSKRACLHSIPDSPGQWSSNITTCPNHLEGLLRNSSGTPHSYHNRIHLFKSCICTRLGNWFLFCALAPEFPPG